MKDHIATASYLLPYLVFGVLSCGSDKDKSDIKIEMMVVLESEGNPENKELQEMACQCIFHIRDWLSKWVTTQKEAIAKCKGRKSQKTQEIEISCQNIENFLHEIPHRTMAIAAYKCHANARGLLHFEHYIYDQIEKR